MAGSHPTRVHAVCQIPIVACRDKNYEPMATVIKQLAEDVVAIAEHVYMS